jgi:hypothetical protein
LDSYCSSMLFHIARTNINGVVNLQSLTKNK